MENAPYTASEAYLKILLGSHYNEIAAEATEEEARHIIEKNIIAFLAEKKRKSPTSNDLLPRIENPDKEYIQTLVTCLMEERKNRGKIVLYHTTEPEMGFVYDVFTQLRHQLLMASGSQLRALRFLDSGFLKLDSEVNKATMKIFMEHFAGKADDNDAYRDLILSTNFSLFGSDQQAWADTYVMFHTTQKKQVSTQPLDYQQFFDYIERETQIPGNYQEYKSIMDRHISATCEGGLPCRQRRLIQIFVDPEVLNDTGYLSVLMGAPVLKAHQIPSLDEPIKILRTDPLQLQDYLKDTRGAILPNVPTINQRVSPLALHDLQVRLFMRPEVMLNPNLITVNNYWRFNPPKNLKGYYAEISTMVNRNLKTWLENGAPLTDNNFAPETVKLKDFTQKVYKGSTGSRAPTAPPLSLEDKLVQFLASAKENQAAQLLEENFETLQHAVFTPPRTRTGSGGKPINLEELLRRNPFPTLLKIAFEKGIFRGGASAFEIFPLNNTYNQHNFLEILSTLQDTEKTCAVYLKYFKTFSSTYFFIDKVLEAIDLIDNDESIIQSSQPLFSLLQEKNITGIIKGVYYLPKNNREEVIKESILIFNKLGLASQLPEMIDIENFLLQVLEMKNLNLDTPHKVLVFSTAMTLSTNWKIRFSLMKELQKVNPETLEIVIRNLKKRKDLGHYTFRENLLNWVKALTVGDESVPSEKHCPTKAYFRSLLTEPSVQEAIQKRGTFTFMDRGETWIASEFQIYSPHGNKIEPLLNKISNLHLMYNASLRDDKWCFAQFNDGSTNSLTIHLDKQG